MARSRTGRLYAEHWDRIAPQWGDEVFNTLLCARNHAVRDALWATARTASRIADFGCGVGTYLPLLSRLFKEVHGFEQSPKCLAIAREKMRFRPNVKLDVAHRATRATRGRFDAVLCVNVAIHPRKSEWNGVLRSMARMLGPEGHFLLVVPALESAELLAACQESPADDDAPALSASGLDIAPRQGIVRFGGVPTKHFTSRELRGALADLGLRKIRLRRVEYSWNSHGITPPRALRNSRPFDWLAVARTPPVRD